VTGAVVMAAGEGRRLRPLTERWPKPVLPVDGRPVLGTLLRALAGAGVERAVVVTGHLAGQVEALVGDGSAFGLRAEFVRQPGVLGSADAVRRALAAGLDPPCLVCGADTVFAPGAIEAFAEAAAGADGAVADPPAPLWLLGPGIVPLLCLDDEPYELANAYARARESGLEIRTLPVGKIRALTQPQDLVVENFPYLGPEAAARGS
jgi:GTP:adenosylcobinamide-phosphate guanylyltransferase